MSVSLRPMSLNGLVIICLSLSPISGPYLDLFGSNSSCPVVWTSNISGVDSLKISADGSYIAVGSFSGNTSNNFRGNGTVSLLATNSNRRLWTYPTGIGQPGPNAVSLSDDGAYLSTGGDIEQLGTNVAVLGISQNVPLWTVKPPFDAGGSSKYGPPYVTSVVSGNGEYVAIHALLPSSGPSAVQGSIILFRRSDASPLWFYNTSHFTYPTESAPISLSYEGAYLTTIDPLTNTLYLFSQHNNQTLWNRKEGAWNTVRISGTGDFIAAQNYTGINTFGKDTNATLLSITTPWLYLNDFSRDGSTIAAIANPSYGNATLNLYDRRTGEELFSVNPAFGVDMASVSSDGSETAVVTESGRLFVYNRSGGLICSAQQGTGTRTFVAISADGRFVVTGNSQLTYMQIASPNNTTFIIAIVAGVAALVAAASSLLIFGKRRGREGVSSRKPSTKVINPSATARRN